jgi:hypothetical protein
MAYNVQGKLSRLTRTGLIPLSLLMLLGACGRTELRFVPPPTELIQDCPSTEPPIVTNGDLVLAVRAGRVDLKNCNADKAGLRKWVSDMQK